MALFLAVLGGAAVVEIHRAITGPQGAVGGRKAIRALKRREEELKQQLEQVQHELEESASRREMSEAERETLEGVCSDLKDSLARMERGKEAMSEKTNDLEMTVQRIQEREKILQQCVESLQLENSMLIQQFERLKVKYEEETAGFESSLKELQKNVSSVLQKFTQGVIDAVALGEELHRLGVEFACPEGQTVVMEELEKAQTEKERKVAVEGLELKIDEKSNVWMDNIRLNSSPARAAKIFLGAQRLSSAESDDTIAAVHDSNAERKQRKTKKKRGFLNGVAKKTAHPDQVEMQEEAFAA